MVSNLRIAPAAPTCPFLLAPTGSVAFAGLPGYEARCDHPAHGAKRWQRDLNWHDDDVCGLLAAHRGQFRGHRPYVVECACMAKDDECHRVVWACWK